MTAWAYCNPGLVTLVIVGTQYTQSDSVCSCFGEATAVTIGTIISRTPERAECSYDTGEGTRVRGVSLASGLGLRGHVTLTGGTVMGASPTSLALT